MVEHIRNSIWQIQTISSEYFFQDTKYPKLQIALSLALEMSAEDLEKEGLNQYFKYTRGFFWFYFFR